MRPFDIVSLHLLKPQPEPPHVEDVQCDFIRPRPEWRGRLSEMSVRHSWIKASILALGHLVRRRPLADPLRAAGFDRGVRFRLVLGEVRVPDRLVRF